MTYNKDSFSYDIQLFSEQQIQYLFLKILDFSSLVQFLVLQLNSQVKHTLSLPMEHPLPAEFQLEIMVSATA